jgi:hypothetical protein
MLHGTDRREDRSLTVTMRPPRFLTSFAMRAPGEAVRQLLVGEGGDLDRMSQSSASCSRCSPSSSTSAEWPARAACSDAARPVRRACARDRGKRFTIAFCRLLMRSIAALLLQCEPSRSEAAISATIPA